MPGTHGGGLVVAGLQPPRIEPRRCRRLRAWRPNSAFVDAVVNRRRRRPMLAAAWPWVPFRRHFCGGARAAAVPVMS